MNSRVLLPSLLALFSLLLAACGSGMSGSSSTGNAVAKSQGCIVSGCHVNTLSKVTGSVIADEWKASIHYRMNVSGCADCHDESHGGGSPCSKCHGGSVPSAANSPERCDKCHGLNHPADRLMSYAPQHFGNMTASASNTRYRASYVSLNYIGKCRKCHNPHDPSTNAAYNANWARSGHGDTLSGSRGSEFKARGNTSGAAYSYGNSQSSSTYSTTNNTLPEQKIYCVRCHTTTGYITFVTSGFTDVSPFPNVVNADAEMSDKTKEVTACDACHTSYAFNLASLRSVPPVTVYYNHRNVKSPNNIDITNNAVTFPNAGYSNMCIPCHSARQNGDVIKLIAQEGYSNFSSLSRVSPHDLGGSASLYRIIGYEFEGLDYSNKANYKHDGIGMASGGATPKGPCIVCHLNAEVRAESHLFMPVKEEDDPTVKSASFGSKITEIASRTCAVAGCHVSSASGIPWTTVEQLQAQKAGFYAAMQALLEWQAVAQTVTYINRNRTPHSPAYTSNWGRIQGVKIPAVTGLSYPRADAMGVTFNYDALKNDPGAFAHNSLYAKRLIYDSINWLRSQVDPTVKVADVLDNIAAGKYDGRVFAGRPSNYSATTTYNPGDQVTWKNTSVTPNTTLVYTNIVKCKGTQPDDTAFWVVDPNTLRSSAYFTATMRDNAKAWLGGGEYRP